MTATELFPTAAVLAAKIADGLTPFKPGPALTTLAEWFTDPAGHRLVLVVGADQSEDAIDEVLAYALAWQGDRDLALVVPETHAGVTLERLPWICTPIRLFRYGADLEPRPATVPARSEVIAAAAARPLRSTESHDLGHRGLWVDALVQDANEHWALVATHRHSYLAWHCAGRQVLRIARSGVGLRIEAGVAYGKPPPGEEAALVVDVSEAEPLTPALRARIELRVTAAVWKRLSGHDRGHVEHRMQAALAATRLLGLGLSSVVREYPAWRGDGRAGFIDFLGVDRSSHLHVVETKVGTADVKGVLQTLDYATWVGAHGADIRAELNWPQAAGKEMVILDLVLAAKDGGRVVGPYLAGQLEALAGDVPWQVAVVEDPLAEVPNLLVPLWRSLPPLGPGVAIPVQPARWAGRTGTALQQGNRT